MPAKNEDLHGSVPDKSSVALLLIDVINDLEFEGGEDLLRHALPMSKNLAELKRRAKEAGVPVIYVNDNFGKWQSDFKKILEHCLRDDVRGRPVVENLKPEDADEDYFVLKPKHSAFFSTTLDILLDYLGARTLVLTGLSGDICVLFTAHDAYMRDFNLVVPSDCIASEDPSDNEYTLRKMAALMDADTRPSSEVDFEELQRRAAREPEPNPVPESKQTARGQMARS